MDSTKTCSVDECSRVSYGRAGLCRLHWLRWKHHGDTTSRRVYSYCGAVCSIDGCEKPAKSRGWCGMHYKRWQIHGDPFYKDHAGPGEGSITTRGYRVFSINGRPRLEHRLVMERMVGRLLEPDEVVHHINGDKLDNRIDNLALYLSNSEHMKRHVTYFRNASHKQCSRCLEIKPRNQFSTARRAMGKRDPHHAQCRPCRAKEAEEKRGGPHPRKLSHEQAVEAVLRHLQGETQEQVASAYGVTPALISHMKLGKCRPRVLVDVNQRITSG